VSVLNLYSSSSSLVVFCGLLLDCHEAVIVIVDKLNHLVKKCKMFVIIIFIFSLLFVKLIM